MEDEGRDEKDSRISLKSNSYLIVTFYSFSSFNVSSQFIHVPCITLSPLPSSSFQSKSKGIISKCSKSVQFYFGFEDSRNEMEKQLKFSFYSFPNFQSISIPDINLHIISNEKFNQLITKKSLKSPLINSIGEEEEDGVFDVCLKIVSMCYNCHLHLPTQIFILSELNKVLESHFGCSLSWEISYGIAAKRAQSSHVYSSESIEVMEDDLSLDILLKAEKTHNNFIHLHLPNPTCKTKRSRCVWKYKLEMMNIALVESSSSQKSSDDLVLIQLDLDEIWTRDQLIDIFQLLKDQDGHKFQCLRFDCHFFISPHLLTVDGYGHSEEYEWVRAWRIPSSSSSVHFVSHTPPVLMMINNDNNQENWTLLHPSDCSPHSFTSKRSLVFSHHAYVDEKTVLFKEVFYGFESNSTENWLKLREVGQQLFNNQSIDLMLDLNQYLPPSWVNIPTHISIFATSKV